MVRNSKAGHYPNQDVWWGPVHLCPPHGARPIFTDAQVKRWLEDGFLICTGLWPEELIQAAALKAAELHPREQVAKHKRGFSEMPWTGEDGPENPLNHMTIHPRAIAAAAQLLDTPQTNVL